MLTPSDKPMPHTLTTMFFTSTLALCPLTAFGNEATGAEIGIGLFHDDNVTAQYDNKIDSEGARLSTRAWLTKQADNLGTQLQLSFDAYHYEKAEDFDFVDSELYSKTVFNPYGGAHTFDFSARLQGQHDEPGTGINQGSRPLEFGDSVRYNRALASLGYRLGDRTSRGMWRLEYHFEERNYIDFKSITARRDRRVHTLSTRFDWSIGYSWSLFAEPQFRRIAYITPEAHDTGDTTQNLDSDSVLFNIGVDIGDRRGISGSAKVGFIDKAFDAPERDDFFGASWDVALKWAPNRRTSLELSTRRQDQEPETSDNLVDVKSYSLSWQQHWREYLRSHLSVGMTDSEYVGNHTTLREDDLGFGQFSVEWQARYNLTITSRLRFTEKNSTNYQYEYNKTYGELNISYELY